MAELPKWLNEQTQEAILQTLLAEVPSDIDKSEGSYIWDSLSPSSVMWAIASKWIPEMLRRGFASKTFGPYLELRSEESGIFRKEATVSKGRLKIVAAPNTVYPMAGKRAAVPNDPNSEEEAVIFTIENDIGTDAAGVAYADIVATQAGARYNVLPDTITFLVDAMTGIVSITNEDSTTGGLDEESDASLLSRLLTRKKNPSSSGNIADYINWANEVIGVGGAAVIPLENGRGTVSVYIVDNDKNTAPDSLVDSVQDSIAPLAQLREYLISGSTAQWGFVSPTFVFPMYKSSVGWSSSGFGVTTDESDVDAPEAVSKKMVYDAGGDGLVYRNVQTYLDQSGIWLTRFSIKADITTGTTDLLEIGMWNRSASAWCKANSDPASADAKITLQGDDLSTEYTWTPDVEFYWDGSDDIEWRVRRFATEVDTTVWIGENEFIATFSSKLGDMKAPIGASVFVRSAVPVPIDISATLTIQTGYDPNDVKQNVINGVEAYRKSIVFQKPADVRYSKIGQVILDTEGVTDYANLLVNGGTANIPINSSKEVPVIGTVTI